MTTSWENQQNHQQIHIFTTPYLKIWHVLWSNWLVNCFFFTSRYSKTNLKVKKSFFPFWISCYTVRQINDEANCTPNAHKNKNDGYQCKPSLCFNSKFLWLVRWKLLAMIDLHVKKLKVKYRFNSYMEGGKTLAVRNRTCLMWATNGLLVLKCYFFKIDFK